MPINNSSAISRTDSAILRCANPNVEEAHISFRVHPAKGWLVNKFAEITDYVQGGNMVIFTRNGYDYMMTMSFDAYKRLNDSVISELNRADDR